MLSLTNAPQAALGVGPRPQPHYAGQALTVGAAPGPAVQLVGAAARHSRAGGGLPGGLKRPLSCRQPFETGSSGLGRGRPVFGCSPKHQLRAGIALVGTAAAPFPAALTPARPADRKNLRHDHTPQHHRQPWLRILHHPRLGNNLFESNRQSICSSAGDQSEVNRAYPPIAGMGRHGSKAARNWCSNGLPRIASNSSSRTASSDPDRRSVARKSNSA